MTPRPGRTRWRRVVCRLSVALIMSLLVVRGAAAEPVTQILHNGPANNRVNMVILGDGYTSGELGKYAHDVSTMVAGFFGQEPFLGHRRYFNVYRVDVVSNQSGASHPERGVSRDTAMRATYNCGGIQRAICVDTSRVAAIVARSALPPLVEITLVIVNDPEYGGTGGSVAVASTNVWGVEIVLHEVGHSFGLLADEYWDAGPPFCHADVEPPEPNVTRETRRDFIKWRAHINAGTPIPTTSAAPSVPGLYQGARYCAAGLWRPTYDSKMRSLDRPFDQVNSEQIVKRIFNFVTPDGGAGLDAFIARFYRNVLGREPDPGGLANWRAFLQAHPTSAGAATFAHGLLESPEFIGQNHSAEAYVTILYRSFMGRKPDAGGLANWVGHLNAGRYTRRGVADLFIESAEFQAAWRALWAMAPE